MHFQPLDDTAHRGRKDRFVDKFIGRRIHGKGELLFLEIELGVDAMGVAARIDANPFAEAGEIKGIKPV